MPDATCELPYGKAKGKKMQEASSQQLVRDWLSVYQPARNRILPATRKRVWSEIHLVRLWEDYSTADISIAITCGKQGITWPADTVR